VFSTAFLVAGPAYFFAAAFAFAVLAALAFFRFATSLAFAAAESLRFGFWTGEGGTAIPGVPWERRRIKEIRGWSLHFKRVSEQRDVGILTRRYRALAKKNGSSAEYQITETMPLPPANVQMKPILVVEPSDVTTCQ
jgi:hypothetical protein